MTQSNKPEWFEITDKDEKPELRKVSKSLPVSAVLVVALILGAGAVVTQTQNEIPASATNVAALQLPQADVNPTTATAVVGAATTNKLVNPSISTLPMGGGDDEDDEYEGDDD
jgi:predicted lysophospholipase L1 biosynthesis ABC-type transport system permease subunit